MAKTIDPLIRVSKMDGRLESSESTITIRDQRRLTAAAIETVGGKPGRELLALDQSGFTFLHSDAVQTALARIRAGESHGVAVAYGDRMMRNWWRLGIFFEELAELGAEFVVSGMEHIDYRTPIGRNVFASMGTASEQVYFAAKSRGDNIAADLLERGVPNRVPYGYRRNWNEEAGCKWVEEWNGRPHPAKALVIDPVTGEVVRRIFRLRDEGRSFAEICSVLNEEGIPAPGGGAWVFSSVRQTLSKVAYIGHVKLGERVNKAAHEPLVSLALFERVKATRKVKRTGRLTAGIAGSIVVCSGCLQPMRVIGGSPDPAKASDKRGKQGRRLSYGCPRLRAAGPCPRPVHVTKDVADAYVEETLAEMLEQSRGVDIVRTARELEVARAAFERAREERESFVSLESALEVEDFKRGYAERRAREAAADAKLESLLAEAGDADGLPTSASAYAALDFEARRRVARRVIDSIVVSPPLSRARGVDITERFDVRFRRSGEVAAALG